jgi:uncharacterized phage-associated protein
MSPFNYRKAVQVINLFVIQEGGSIDKLKIVKLIWLADRLHLRKYGRPILMDNYYAMIKGPIPSHTKDLTESENVYLNDQEIAYRDEFLSPTSKIFSLSPRKKNYTIKSIKKADTNVLSKTDIQCIDIVYSAFGGNTGNQLSEISHFYPEWNKYQEQLNNDRYSTFPMFYEDFFNNPITDNSPIFDQTPEDLRISKEIFSESFSLHNFL